MGYLFQNIDQLAGFFLNQGEKGCSKNSAAQVSDISFESIFDSITGQFKNKPNAIPEIGYPDENIELKERIFINEDTLKALIENQGNIVTLEIPSDEISLNSDDLSSPVLNKKEGTTLPLIDFSGVTKAPLTDDIAVSSFRISFDTAGLFNQDRLPVELIDSGGQKTSQLIDVSRLVQLISEYPEPVQTEIEIMPERENNGDQNELKSSFRFDLRDLFKTGHPESRKSIEGLISLSTGKLSRNPIPESNNITYDNKEVFAKATLLETNEPRSDNNFSNLNMFFPVIKRTSISLPDPKKYDIRGDNSDRPIRGYVVPESLDEIEETKAGEVKSDNKDNPSALSKITAGPENTSEATSAKFNNGSFGVSADQNGLLENATIKNNLKDITEINIKNSENIQNAKASILDAIEHGRSTVRMRLHPENLGTLHIKLHWRAGTLLTEFRVENVKASEAVSAMLPELKASLEDANLKLMGIDVIVNDRGREFSSALSQQNHSGSAWNGPDKRGRLPFEDYDNTDTGAINEKTDRIGSLESRSSHKGWIDLEV
jgi:hypothetical protein